MRGSRPSDSIASMLRHVDGDPFGVLDLAAHDPDAMTTPFDRIDEVGPAHAVAESETAESRSDALGSQGDQVAHATPVRIGRYAIEEKIGQGTFGVVYTARDTELDREVALKVLNQSHHGDGEVLHRFLREARAAARIAHPGIVVVYDFGRVRGGDRGGDELAYIAMERLRGESLTRRIERHGRLEVNAAIEIARQVASALEAAHRADVLHRDLKPDNVFLVPDPAVAAGERVKVLDFGLAKIGRSRHTQLGAVFGTPLYMSPEQCLSSGNIDARSDVYSLGCIVFELVTGRAPFEGEVYDVLECHLRRPAPRASARVEGVPPALDQLIAQMLEKEPAARPASMAEVMVALEGVRAAARVHAVEAYDAGRTLDMVEASTFPGGAALARAVQAATRQAAMVGTTVTVGPAVTVVGHRAPPPVVAGSGAIAAAVTAAARPASRSSGRRAGDGGAIAVGHSPRRTPSPESLPLSAAIAAASPATLVARKRPPAPGPIEAPALPTAVARERVTPAPPRAMAAGAARRHATPVPRNGAYAAGAGAEVGGEVSAPSPAVMRATPARCPRKPLALVAAVTIALALAGTLSWIAAHRRAGLVDASEAVQPAASRHVR